MPKTFRGRKQKRDRREQERMDDYLDKYESESNKKQLLKVRPQTVGQKDLWDALKDPYIKYVAVSGPAGSGKTFLTCYHAMQSLERCMMSKIQICRSVTEVKDEEIGFLPGGIDEKMAAYLVPLTENLQKFTQPESYREYQEGGMIEIVPLAMARGRSLEESFVIADEAQNISLAVFKMLLTRVADSSKLVFLGDFNQNDKHVGTTDFERVCDALEGGLDGAFKHVELTYDDVIRSKHIREICERLDCI